MLESAAAARVLADTAAATAPPGRPLTLAERRALNQAEGEPEDEAAAAAADAAADLAAATASGGLVGLRVAPDLAMAGIAARADAARHESGPGGQAV